MIPNEFSIDGDLDEASEDDLRETVKEFMEKHEENREAFEQLEEDASEYQEEAESAQGKVDTMKSYFAEEVAEASPLFSAEEIAEKHDAETLMNKASDASEFTATEDGQEGEVDEGGEESEFAEREQKSREEGGTSGPSNEFAQQAQEDLAALGFEVDE